MYSNSSSATSTTPPASSTPGCGFESADYLSEVLRDLRISCASYCRTEFAAPWGVAVPAHSQRARFHYVAQGSCWLCLPDRAPQQLIVGDMVLLPHGGTYALVDQPDTAARAFESMPREYVSRDVYVLREGGNGERCVIICSGVEFEESVVHPLLELMPDVLHVRGGALDDVSLIVMLDAMAAESNSNRVGSATVMARLADIVITRLIRAWVERSDAETCGWLAAVRDPQIGRALALIHRQPEHPWSVASLASAATLSRTLFSERFTTLVGMSPARYVARWRMHLASIWLGDERLNVSEVAARLGYESEASFSRAFKRFTGVPPGAVRRQNGSTIVLPTSPEAAPESSQLPALPELPTPGPYAPGANPVAPFGLDLERLEALLVGG
jgi:AraC-like DNA-binding protein